MGQRSALLKLATSVDRPVTPIHRQKISLDSAVTQVGYGVTNDQGQGGGILRKLSEHNRDCAITGDPAISNDKVLCFDPADGGGCYGDSGGPTFFDVSGKLEVVGVTSGGTGQGCTDSWGIWTLVPSGARVDRRHHDACASDARSDAGPDARSGSAAGSATRER